MIKSDAKKLLSLVMGRFVIALFFLVVLAILLYAPRAYEYFVRPGQEINVYAFMDVVSTRVFREFEKETGIRVRVSYFESNEELLAKFKISKGEGYDLVTVSDYMVYFLRKYDLLQKIDTLRLANIQHVDKRLLGHPFDTGNEYSVPAAWSPYGIGFNKTIGASVKNWTSVFEQNSEIAKRWGRKYKVCIPDDVNEVVPITAFYLYGSSFQLTDDKLNRIEKVLIAQKKQIERYTSSSLKYFLYANIVPLVVSCSAAMKGVMYENDKFDFIIPEGGSILTIENVAIPSASKNVDVAHRLIDFILSKKAQLASFSDCGYNPSNILTYEHIDEKFRNRKSFFPDDEMFAQLHLISPTIDIKKYEKLWLAVKSS